MLKNTPAIVSFSVDDIVKAKEFYASKLNLAVDELGPGMLQLNLAHEYKVWVYAKPNHKPATYTVLNFTVSDLSKAMKELSARGVKFEQYDLPEQNLKTDKDGVVDYGVMRIAFFNDTAGNNHAVLQMTQ